MKKNVEKICENPEDLRVPVIRFYRKISVIIVKRLLGTKITANQITYIGFVFYVLSAYFFFRSDYNMLIIAAIFLQLGYLCDYLDGSLSRLRGQSTEFGHWLDLLSGTYGWPLIFIGITLGVYKQVPEQSVIWLGFLATIAIPLKNITQNYYSSIFKFARSFRKKTYQKRGSLLISLRYTHVFLIPLLTLGALFNKMYLILLFCGIYGSLYTVVQTLVLTLRAKKSFKK